MLALVIYFFKTKIMRLRRSISILLVAVILATACESLHASTASPLNSPSNEVARLRVEVANLRADMRVLDRLVREQGSAMEDLARQNRELASQMERLRGSQPANTVSQAEMNLALRELRERQESAAAEQHRQILRQVTRQMEQLATETQEALDGMARTINTRRPAADRSSSSSTAAPSFSDDFPREGITYTVQRGDTLSGIAARHNSTVRDIQNANRIANPQTLQVGQVLFIPQRN